jgi:cytochrome c oxidase subunit 2
MKRPALLAGLCLLLAGCSGMQSALNPASDQASRFMDIWHLMLVICGVMYALVLAFLAAALWRSRTALAAEPIADGAQSARERPLRTALVGWTGLVVAGLLVLAGGSFMIDRSLARASTDNAVRIKITGAQWWWKVEYEDPVSANRVTTANELHLPVNRPAVIELHAEDVIHSFWIPNLGGKLDLIPGRTTRIVFNPRREGLYRGQCAEFCGLEHSLMALDATVESPPAFDAWRARQRMAAVAPSTPQQQRGQQVFMQGPCASCHAIVGTGASGRTGPDLTHVASRRSLAAGALPAGRTSLVAWLHNDQGFKPGVHMPQVALPEADIQALAAYLDALK